MSTALRGVGLCPGIPFEGCAHKKKWNRRSHIRARRAPGAARTCAVRVNTRVIAGTSSDVLQSICRTGGGRPAADQRPLPVASHLPGSNRGDYPSFRCLVVMQAPDDNGGAFDLSALSACSRVRVPWIQGTRMHMSTTPSLIWTGRVLSGTSAVRG